MIIKSLEVFYIDVSFTAFWNRKRLLALLLVKRKVFVLFVKMSLRGHLMCQNAITTT